MQIDVWLMGRALKIFIIFLRFLGTVLMAYFDVFEVFYIQKWIEFIDT